MAGARLLAGFAFLTSLLFSPIAAAQQDSFVETFKSIDESRWYVSDGWENGSHQGCTWSRKNVSVENGALELRLTPAAGGDRPHACAELQSEEFFGHGVYEVRMSAPSASGTVSAFFTYTGPVHDNPWDEVDVEILGKDTRRAQLNYYTDGEGGNEELIDLGFDSAEAMNDYAFSWEPGALRWYVNGELVHEVQGRPETLPATPSKIFLSLWNGQGETMRGWLGPFEPAEGAMRMRVERVAYTAPGDACQFPESIVCDE